MTRAHGRRNTYRCATCGYTARSYAALERHQDTEHDGHGRIDIVEA